MRVRRHGDGFDGGWRWGIQEKAKKAFEKAQKIDPRCIDTAMALVDLLMQQASMGASVSNSGGAYVNQRGDSGGLYVKQ